MGQGLLKHGLPAPLDLPSSAAAAAAAAHTQSGIITIQIQYRPSITHHTTVPSQAPDACMYVVGTHVNSQHSDMSEAAAHTVMPSQATETCSHGSQECITLQWV